VKFEVRKSRAQRRPFRFCFLHAIFAEDALPGGERGQNRFRRKRLRHRHQRHARRIAAAAERGFSDFGANEVEPLGGIRKRGFFGCLGHCGSCRRLPPRRR